MLREQGGGIVMQFSSTGGRVGGSPGIASYQAAKFAIDGFPVSGLAAGGDSQRTVTGVTLRCITLVAGGEAP